MKGKIIILAITLMVISCGGGAEKMPADTSITDKGDAVAGKEVYDRTCIACHQADGKALGGSLGADFVGDPSYLAKDDAILIKSIKEGKTGTNKSGGVMVMPPNGTMLSANEMVNALTYIRKTFGAQDF